MRFWLMRKKMQLTGGLQWSFVHLRPIWIFVYPTIFAHCSNMFFIDLFSTITNICFICLCFFPFLIVPENELLSGICVGLKVWKYERLSWHFSVNNYSSLPLWIFVLAPCKRWWPTQPHLPFNHFQMSGNASSALKMVFLEAPPTFQLFPKGLLGVVKLSYSPTDHGSVKQKEKDHFSHEIILRHYIVKRLSVGCKSHLNGLKLFNKGTAN